MARIAWKLAMLCSSLLLGGCGEDDDTGDSRPIDQPEYGTWGVEYQLDADETAPLPADWHPTPERDARG
jgi:major membrane immunogen (membrane-anchored lipoprotein)